MSQSQEKDLLSPLGRDKHDPGVLLRNSRVAARLRKAGVLRYDSQGESTLWKAMIKSPFGKAIGLVAYRTYWVRASPLTEGTMVVFLLDGRRHGSTSYFRLGDYIAVSPRELAEIVTTFQVTKTHEDQFACVSQLGDVGELDMTPLQVAEFDFQHCPRLWNEESQTREFDTDEYFRRLDHLNGLRRAVGMPDCSEGVTPSTYDA